MVVAKHDDDDVDDDRSDQVEEITDSIETDTISPLTASFIPNILSLTHIKGKESVARIEIEKLIQIEWKASGRGLRCWHDAARVRVNWR